MSRVSNRVSPDDARGWSRSSLAAHIIESFRNEVIKLAVGAFLWLIIAIVAFVP
jgi:hypothetical protein